MARFGHTETAVGRRVKTLRLQWTSVLQSKCSVFILAFWPTHSHHTQPEQLNEERHVRLNYTDSGHVLYLGCKARIKTMHHGNEHA
jgi:hypothetical protein